MSTPIERHSPEVWRKTAEQMNVDNSDTVRSALSDGNAPSCGGVNKNGAPLLGDSRDLFRPKTSDIPAQPGAISGETVKAGSFMWARPKTCATV